MARVVDTQQNQGQEEQWETKLRPQSFDQFPGQDSVKEKLSIFIEAAKKRSEPLDHTLFCGPPGLGKTTLAYILAHSLGVDIKVTSGPALDKKGDLAALLTGLQPNSILFIDEIHRLNRTLEEYIYSAMEDYYIDIVTGEGLGARSMQFKLAPFTLVGATTRAGLLNAPFRDRFGIVERLNFYDKSSLTQITKRSADLLGVKIEENAALELATRSRGTPRVVNRLLRRVRDYAEVKGDGIINLKLARFALEQLGVDSIGLDPMDRKILELMIYKFDGKPVGIDTISASLGEERDTIEEVYEPYLLQEALIQKTPRGRIPTKLAYEHLGAKLETKVPQQQLDL